MGSNKALSPDMLASGRLRVQLDKVIQKLNYDKTPLLRLLTAIGKESTKGMKFQWLQKSRIPDWGGIASYGGDWSSGADTEGEIVVTAGEGWMYGAGDVIRVPATSAVNLYVVSVSTDTLTCKTYDGATTVDFSAGATGAAKLLNISNSFELGSNRGTMRSAQPAEAFNYIQIVQNPYGVLEEMQHLEYDAGGQEKAEQEQETLLKHEFNKEKTLWFGQKHKATVGYMDGAYEQYFTGGIIEAITTNVSTESTLTQAEFGAWVNNAIYYAKKPLIFCGAKVFEALTWWAGQKLQVQRSDKTLGMAVANYQTEYGDLVNFMPHRELFVNDFAGMAVCLDLADIKYRYLDGEDTHLVVGIETPGQKMTINEYRTWMGLWMGNEKRHAVLKGVTTIAA